MGNTIGQAAKLYRQTTGTRASWGTADGNGFNAGAAPSNLDEIVNVKDLDYDAADGQSDISRRLSAFKGYIPGLTDLQLTFGMVYDPSDADFLALMKAKINKSSIAAVALDAAKTTVGTIGVWADWNVYTLQKTEHLEEGQMVNFTLKPDGRSNVPPEFVIVTA